MQRSHIEISAKLLRSPSAALRDARKTHGYLHMLVSLRSRCLAYEPSPQRFAKVSYWIKYACSLILYFNYFDAGKGNNAPLTIRYITFSEFFRYY